MPPAPAFTVLLAALALAGCGREVRSAPQDGRGVGVVPTGGWCGESGKTPKATLLQSEDDLRGFYRRQDKLQIGERSEPPAADFGQYQLLLLEMGERPTAGYALALAETRLRVSEGTAVLRIHWETPAPGVATAQVVTSPCLLLSVPRGDYRRVRVLDQGGTTRFELPSP